MTDVTTTANQGGAAAEPAATPTTETIVSVGTETESTVAETPAQGAAPEAPISEEPLKRTPWWQKRIEQKTAQYRDATARAEAAERARDMYRALAEGRTPPEGEVAPAVTPEPAKAAVTLPETEIERRATEIANARVRANEFNAACNRTFEAGKKDFADFEASRDSLVSNMGDSISPEFLQALTAIPDGHKVFYALGKDLDEAARILALPPIPMALELAKMAAVPKGKTLSKAPAPITPIDGTAKPAFNRDTCTQEEFEDYFYKLQAKKRA